MRIGECIHYGERRVAVFYGDTVALAPIAEFPNLLAVIDGGPQALLRLADQNAAWTRVPLSQVRSTAPIPRPRKNIVCLGWNYVEHLRESAQARGKDAELPEHPIVFTKAVTSVAGPADPIPYDPRVSTQLDWEVELGVVIGKSGRHIAAEQALEHVFGYTIINDVSARDVQFRHKQYFLGKSIDGTCPIGPYLVTRDEIPDPQCLDLRCWVNGVLKQESNTRYQIFPVAKIIAVLSSIMTLEPGDIIATGTPSGVGFARQPPEYLQPGDRVECEIQRIGRLANDVRAVGA